MKPIFLAIICLATSACETVSSDGTITRWDPAATKSVIDAGFGVWDRYQRANAVVGYDGYGNPIYAR